MCVSVHKSEVILLAKPRGGRSKNAGIQDDQPDPLLASRAKAAERHSGKHFAGAYCISVAQEIILLRSLGFSAQLFGFH